VNFACRGGTIGMALV